MPEYFSYKQAMKYMGFTAPKTLTEYIKQGLPTIQVGKSKRIAKSDIDKGTVSISKKVRLTEKQKERRKQVLQNALISHRASSRSKKSDIN